jgi:hypothetical protein
VRFDTVGGNSGRDPFTLAFFINTASPTQQAILEKRPVCDAASFWGFRMTVNLWGAELDGDEFGTDNTGCPGRADHRRRKLAPHRACPRRNRQHHLRGRSESRDCHLASPRAALEHRAYASGNERVHVSSGSDNRDRNVERLVTRPRTLSASRREARARRTCPASHCTETTSSYRVSSSVSPPVGRH